MAPLLPLLSRSEQLPPEAAAMLEPVKTLPNGEMNPSYQAHLVREQQLRRLNGYETLRKTTIARCVGDTMLPYMTAAGIRETFDNTQYPPDNHRLFAPLLQGILHDPDTRDKLMASISERCQNDTEQLFGRARRNRAQLLCDIAVLGSGPHGAAAAGVIREKYPSLTIYMVEAESNLGGLWGNNGPNPSFMMNSRVRRANRSLPAVPRSPGNINPLGSYAVLELSDLVAGSYAYDTEMGDITALNAYLSINAALVNTTCSYIYDSGSFGRMALRSPSGESIDLQATVVIDACGITQTSTLSPTPQDRVADQYFDTRDLYRGFGNFEQRPTHRPLEQFAGRTVLGIGGGDSLLTGIDALVGNLPKQSYGPYGPGRDRIGGYVWIGAPGETAAAIDNCLRARYKNGIIQNLPKSPSDQGAIIRPIPMRARGFTLTPDGVDVRLENDDVISGDFLFDHTNKPIPVYGPSILDTRRSPYLPSAVVKVGPAAKPQLSLQTMQIIESLGIPENTASLWALMEITNEAAFQAGRLAVTNVRLNR